MSTTPAWPLFVGLLLATAAGCGAGGGEPTPASPTDVVLAPPPTASAAEDQASPAAGDEAEAAVDEDAAEAQSVAEQEQRDARAILEEAARRGLLAPMDPSNPGEVRGFGGLGARPIGSGGPALPLHVTTPAKGYSSPGLAREEVLSAARPWMPRMESCFARGRRRAPALAGEVTLEVVVDAAGEVQSSSVASSTLGDTEVESCLAAITTRLSFAARPGGAPVTIRFPVALAAD